MANEGQLHDTKLQASFYLIKCFETVICLLNQKLFVHCNYNRSE